MNKIMLRVLGLTKHFGGVHAVNDVSCEVHEGDIYAVIGPNGAGKTTFFNCLSGVVPPTNGTIKFEGNNLTAMPTHAIAAHGIARTWQTIRLFAHMSVMENVLVGCHCRGKCGMIGSMLRMPRLWREEKAMRQEAMHQLERLEIADLANKPIGALPFIQQRRVELARALAAHPRLLLLDEPAAGLNTRETAQLGDLIRSIRSEGVTILLVEHDMSLVMEISDRLLVLDHGTPVAEGSPREVQENEKVIAIYLGLDDE